MTTNVREKLDPALVRPGRVNQRIELGPMRWDEAKVMAEYSGPGPPRYLL
eukprot:gene4213-4606_t